MIWATLDSTNDGQQVKYQFHSSTIQFSVSAIPHRIGRLSVSLAVAGDSQCRTALNLLTLHALTQSKSISIIMKASN